MLPGQMLPGQMSSWLLESVHEGPRSLHLKFGQNPVSNNRDIADLELSVGGVKSFSCKTQVRLSWGWVGVLTIYVYIWINWWPQMLGELFFSFCQMLAIPNSWQSRGEALSSAWSGHWSLGHTLAGPGCISTHLFSFNIVFLTPGLYLNNISCQYSA